MKRNLEKIESEKYDVLVIGGGIHGAIITWEAARRGYKTCLVEKSDFGSETSANSLKVLHGGFRYLQHGNIKRMRESIYSRKIFQKVAPHLVKNVPFIFPTKKYTITSRTTMSIALMLNDIISCDRNNSILAECKIPTGKTISKQKLGKIIPDYNKTNISGGAVWYESVAQNTERILMEFLHSAAENGAELANYVKAEELIVSNNNVSKVIVNDEINNKKLAIEAKVVVDSVGPWINELLTEETNLEDLKSPLTKAVNIIVKKNYFKEYAIGLESVKEFIDKEAIINKGKRLFFIVPLGDYTMIGTTYKVYNNKPDSCRIDNDDVEEILDEINNCYKGFNITFDDITQFHTGILPMQNEEIKDTFNVQPDKHSLVFDHNSKSIKNLISVKSVKYATAPSIAKQVAEILNKKNLISSSNIKRDDLNKNSLEAKKIFFEGSQNYSTQLLNRLWNTYGLRSSMIINLIEENEQNRKLVFENEEIYFGELLYNYKNEMAIKPKDFISRRLGIDSMNILSEEYEKKIIELLPKLNSSK